MNWAIVYLAGACCLVSASCARNSNASSLLVLRGMGTLLLMIGGFFMLLGGAFVEVLLVGGLCVVVMAFATWMAKNTTTAGGWFAVPGVLIIASIVLLWTLSTLPAGNAPRIIFDDESTRQEQLVILEDAWTELELLDQRGFPAATQAARSEQDWRRLENLETVRNTIPMLRARIAELRTRLQSGPPSAASGEAVRTIAERITRIDEFIQPGR